MTAFILGHGLSRFQGYVTEEVHSVMWDPKDNPESWKDFVELAKKAGSEFLSMDEEVLQRDELDYLKTTLGMLTRSAPPLPDQRSAHLDRPPTSESPGSRQGT